MSGSIKRTIYWQETEPVTLRGPLPGDETCDVCLVGAGYTSLWTALALTDAEPGLDVRIVEADYAGAGASGHNDGFLTPTIGHSLETVVSQLGPERAKTAFALLGRSIVELIRFCDRNDIDAEIEPNGFYLVAASAGQVRRLQHDIALADQFGGRMKLTLLDREQMRERLPAPVVQAGIESGGALINPFKLARGLARVAVGRGVTIYEKTRVAGVEADGGWQRVLTDRGTVRARHVVMGTNAYQHRFRPFRRHVIPVWSYALVSEPLTDEQLKRSEWSTRQGFVETRNFVVFGRLTADDRILVGGGPAPYYLGRNMSEAAHMRHDRIEAGLRAAALRFLPQLDDLRWSHFYGGPVAMTRRLVPQIGTWRAGLHFAHGYCGNGIATTHLAGKVLRDLVLGRESNYTALGFVGRDQPRFPPEPLAYLGAKAVTLALRARDARDERDGR